MDEHFETWFNAAMRGKKTTTQPSAINADVDRVDPKRSLAEHAIATLARLGYAQTSLRDIAKCSGLSVGIIHYHFKDKVDLIAYCTRLYKEEFVREIDTLVSRAHTPNEVIGAFIAGAVAAIESPESAERHRLWFDIRAQAMFDNRFHSALNEIEAALIGMSERFCTRLTQTGAQVINLTPAELYIVVDGFFRFYLQRRLTGDLRATSDFRKALRKTFKLVVCKPEN
jgi:AcrR family transcriptional regulator